MLVNSGVIIAARLTNHVEGACSWDRRYRFDDDLLQLYDRPKGLQCCRCNRLLLIQRHYSSNLLRSSLNLQARYQVERPMSRDFSQVLVDRRSHHYLSRYY